MRSVCGGGEGACAPSSSLGNTRAHGRLVGCLVYELVAWFVDWLLGWLDWTRVYLRSGVKCFPSNDVEYLKVIANNSGSDTEYLHVYQRDVIKQVKGDLD